MIATTGHLMEPFPKVQWNKNRKNAHTRSPAHSFFQHTVLIGILIYSFPHFPENTSLRTQVFSMLTTNPTTVELSNICLFPNKVVSVLEFRLGIYYILRLGDRSFFWVSHVVAGAQGFRPFSNAFPGYQQGSESEMEPRFKPVPIGALIED